jgi:hypothetical protein
VYDGVDVTVYGNTSPPVYVEPSPEPVVTPTWYYCTDPAGYYPYVQQCTKPWIPVVPQSVPPPQAPAQ